MSYFIANISKQAALDIADALGMAIAKLNRIPYHLPQVERYHQLKRQMLKARAGTISAHDIYEINGDHNV